MATLRELGGRRVAAVVHALHCRLQHVPGSWLSWGTRVSAPSARSRRHAQQQRGQRLLCSATSSSAQASYSAPAPGRRTRYALPAAKQVFLSKGAGGYCACHWGLGCDGHSACVFMSTNCHIL